MCFIGAFALINVNASFLEPLLLINVKPDDAIKTVHARVSQFNTTFNKAKLK